MYLGRPAEVFFGFLTSITTCVVRLHALPRYGLGRSRLQKQ
ncbi:TPA_asm: hypothetical protein [Porphyromonas phage phage022a_WW2931]|uniref:Uncharacterized protein n=2 Tax=Schifferlevirus TaxID=3425076 RepID=A0AAT9J8X4_9CAUD